MDLDTAFSKMNAPHYGPSEGCGRGPGRPWGGIVEQSPALWVVWIVRACKGAGVKPVGMRVAFYGVPLEWATVSLTFGPRHYWLCPLCGRRCEAVFWAGKVGCRKCLRLGYESQAHRPGSAWFYLGQMLRGRHDFRSGRYDDDKTNETADAVIRALRGELRAELRHLVEQVKVVPAGGEL